MTVYGVMTFTLRYFTEFGKPSCVPRALNVLIKSRILQHIEWWSLRA